MNTTKAEALKLATQAIAKGLILTVPAYSGRGVFTAGPNQTATGKGPRFAVHSYGLRTNFSREEFMPSDCAVLLLEYCGRGALGRAARAALSSSGKAD